jgi:hypothetical protein
MKTKTVIGLLAISLTVAGCSSTGFNSNRKISKLAPAMTKMFINEHGCNRLSSSTVISSLKQSDSSSENSIKEHWRILACGKTYDLAITLSKDGKKVSLEKYKP